MAMRWVGLLLGCAVSLMAQSPAAADTRPVTGDATESLIFSPENERAAVWGVLGELAGTAWDEGENVIVYRWIQPNQSLEKTLHYPSGTVTYRYALNAEGNAIFGEGTSVDGRTYAVQVTNPQLGVSMQEMPAKATREITRLENGRLFRRMERISAGTWTSSKEVEPLRLTAEAATRRVAALAKLKLAKDREKAEQARLELTWGDLALLPGKSWFCVAYQPAQWLQRRHSMDVRAQSLPVARMTTARWLELGRSMQLMSQQGDARWTDHIEIKPDGNFALTTTGLTSFTNLIGRKDASGQVIFPTGSTGDRSFTSYHSLIFGRFGYYPMMSLAIGYDAQSKNDSSATCTMKEFTESQATRFAQELEHARREEAGWIEAGRDMLQRAAEREAEGAAMLAGMQASALSEFAKIPGVIADVKNQRLELDRLRRAAEAETAAKANSTAPAAGASVAVAAPDTDAAAPPDGARTSASTGADAVPPRSGSKMYGWCYADQDVGGKVMYSSQIGSTDNHDPSRENWQTVMEAEFARQLRGPYKALACYAQLDPANFSYVRSGVYDNADQVIEVPWAPH